MTKRVFETFFGLLFKKPETFSEFIFTILRFLFLLIFLWIFINVCCFNSSSMYQFNMPLAVSIAFGVLVGLLYLVYKVKKYSNANRPFNNFLHRHSIPIALAGLAGLFVFQAVAAKATYHLVGWDCGNIVKCAVQGNLSSESFYFSTYPNNLLIYCIIKYLLKAFFWCGGTNYWLFLSVVNILIVDLAVFLVFIVCRNLFGLACGFISYILFILIFGITPWLVVPYSDTFAIIFPPLIILAYLKFLSAKKVAAKGIYLFLLGLLSVIGYYIKPYVLIVCLAIVIYMLISNINGLKKFSLFFLSALVIFLGGFSSWTVYKTTIKDAYADVLDYSQSVPMSYYFMMGLNTAVSKGTGKTLYGAYSGTDNLFLYSLPTPEAKRTETMKEALKRIKAYTPAGYVKFLSDKANWVFSDGTFWAEGEGYDVEKPSISGSNFSKWVQSFLRFYGKNFSVFANFVQGIWVLLLFLLVIPLINCRNDFKSGIVNVMRIIILGFLIYQVLFEARPRYIITILPAIIILSVSGFSNFIRNFYSYDTGGSGLYYSDSMQTYKM